MDMNEIHHRINCQLKLVNTKWIVNLIQYCIDIGNKIFSRLCFFLFMSGFRYPIVMHSRKIPLQINVIVNNCVGCPFVNLQSYNHHITLAPVDIQLVQRKWKTLGTRWHANWKGRVNDQRVENWRRTNVDGESNFTTKHYISFEWMQLYCPLYFFSYLQSCGLQFGCAYIQVHWCTL